MTDFIRRINYYYTMVPNHPGEGTRVFNVLKKGSINLVAINGFQIDAQRAQIGFVPSDKDAFLQQHKKRASNWVGPKLPS